MVKPLVVASPELSLHLWLSLRNWTATFFRTSIRRGTCAMYLDTSRESKQTRLADRYVTEKRQDDREVTIQIQLKTFEGKHMVVVRHFESEGRLEAVDGNTNVD